MASINYDVKTYTTTEITGDGVRTDYSPTFPALQRSNVIVYVNNVPTTTGITITHASYGAIPSVTFQTPPTSAQTVRVTLDGIVANIADTNFTDTAYDGETIQQRMERILFSAAVIADRNRRNATGGASALDIINVTEPTPNLLRFTRRNGNTFDITIDGGVASITATSPVSGDGSVQNPLTIQDGAIARSKLSTAVQNELSNNSLKVSAAQTDVTDVTEPTDGTIRITRRDGTTTDLEISGGGGGPNDIINIQELSDNVLTITRRSGDQFNITITGGSGGGTAGRLDFAVADSGWTSSINQYRPTTAGMYRYFVTSQLNNFPPGQTQNQSGILEVSVIAVGANFVYFQKFHNENGVWVRESLAGQTTWSTWEDGNTLADGSVTRAKLSTAVQNELTANTAKVSLPTTGGGGGRSVVDVYSNGQITPQWRNRIHGWDGLANTNSGFEMGDIFRHPLSGPNQRVYIVAAGITPNTAFTAIPTGTIFQISGDGISSVDFNATTRTLTITKTDGTTETANIPGGGSGGSTSFLGLSDTPGSFSGQGDKIVKVNAGATALEFSDPPSGGQTLTIRSGEPLEINNDQLQLNEDGTTIESFTNAQNRNLLRVKDSGISTAKIANDAVNNDKLANSVVDAITANTAKRSYPQSDENKLARIEDDATADQTGAEIVTRLIALSGGNRLPASAIRDLPSGGTTWKGEYQNNTAYAVGDRVIYNGEIYVCTTAVPASNTTVPSGTNSSWAHLSNEGGYDTAAELVTALEGISTDSDKLDGSALKNGTVDTAQIANDAVDNDKLANSVVSAITANTAKRSYPQADENKLATVASGATVGATTAQALAIAANTQKTSAANDDLTGAPSESGGTLSFPRRSGNPYTVTLPSGGASLASNSEFETGTITTKAPTVAQTVGAVNSVRPVLSFWDGESAPNLDVNTGTTATIAAGSSVLTPYDTINKRITLSQGNGAANQVSVSWSNELIDWNNFAMGFKLLRPTKSDGVLAMAFFGADATTLPTLPQSQVATQGFAFEISRGNDNAHGLGPGGWLFGFVPYTGSAASNNGRISPTLFNGAVAGLNGTFNYVSLPSDPFFTVQEVNVVIVRAGKLLKLYAKDATSTAPAVKYAEWRLTQTQQNRTTGSAYGFRGGDNNAAGQNTYLKEVAVGNPDMEMVEEAFRVGAPSTGGTAFTGVTLASGSGLLGDGTSANGLAVANPFTPDDETKLDGIADNATVGATTAQANAITANTAKVGLYALHATAIGVWTGVSGNPGDSTVIATGTTQFDSNDVYLSRTDATGKAVSVSDLPAVNAPINWGGYAGTVSAISENSNRIKVTINYTGQTPLANSGHKFHLYNVADPSVSEHGVYADDSTLDGTGDPADRLKVKDGGISNVHIAANAAIAGSKLGDGSVAGSKLLGNTITAAHLDTETAGSTGNILTRDGSSGGIAWLPAPSGGATVLPTWSSGTAYAINTPVVYNGKIFRALQAVSSSSSNVSPDMDTYHWEQMDNWDGFTNYSTGDRVVSSGSVYRALNSVPGGGLQPNSANNATLTSSSNNSNYEGGFASGNNVWFIRGGGGPNPTRVMEGWTHNNGTLTRNASSDVSLSAIGNFGIGNRPAGFAIGNRVWIVEDVRSSPTNFLRAYTNNNGTLTRNSSSDVSLVSFNGTFTTAFAIGDLVWLVDTQNGAMRGYTHSNGTLTRTSANDVTSGVNNAWEGAVVVGNDVWLARRMTVGGLRNTTAEGFTNNNGTLTRNTVIDFNFNFPSSPPNLQIRGGLNIGNRVWFVGSSTDAGVAAAFDFTQSTAPQSDSTNWTAETSTAWSGSSTYAANAIVSNNSLFYISSRAVGAPHTHEPNTATTFWEQLTGHGTDLLNAAHSNSSSTLVNTTDIGTNYTTVNLSSGKSLVGHAEFSLKFKYSHQISFGGQNVTVNRVFHTVIDGDEFRASTSANGNVLYYSMGVVTAAQSLNLAIWRNDDTSFRYGFIGTTGFLTGISDMELRG